MTINGITEKRWPAYLILLLASCIVLLGYLARSEDIPAAAAAFGALFWFTQVPGSLALLLFEGRVGGRLRFLLLGQALGLALLPLVYLLLLTLGIAEHYTLVQSVVNLLLLGAAVLRGRAASLRRLLEPVPAGTLLGLSIVILAVVASVAIRELVLFHPERLVISSSQEVDAGYLMGMVNGIRRSGHLIDVNGGGVPMHYHYFTYLVMALVGKGSGAEDLTVYQAVFPIYLFLFLALSTYHTTRRIGGRTGAAVLSGLLILFLNDLSIVNNVIAAATGSEAYTIFYATLNVAYLHGSPSWVISIALMMVLVGEIARIYRRNGGFFDFLPFIVIISIMAGYKVPAWMCLTGGTGLASLLLVRRRPAWLLASIVSGVGGALVLLFWVGVSTGKSALGSMYIGYPVLRNDALQRVSDLGTHMFSMETITPGVLLLVVLLIPFWLLLTYGVRIVWVVGAVRRFGALLRENNLLELTVLLSIGVGLAIALLAAPERSPLLVYYNSIYGLLVSTPFTAIVLADYLRRHGGVRRYALVALILVQMSSGFLYLAKPILQKKQIADLGGDWLAAMTFLRNQTPTDAILLSNRYGFSTDSTFSTYNEQFYFVPAFSRRSVVVSGNRYYLELGPEYERKRRLADTVFTTTSGAKIREIGDSLDFDYIVFDRWKGDSLRASDPAYLEKVYSNPKVDIYRLRRDGVTGQHGDSILNRER